MDENRNSCKTSQQKTSEDPGSRKQEVALFVSKMPVKSKLPL